MSKTGKERNRDHDLFIKGILSLNELVLLLLYRYLPQGLQRYVDFSTLQLLSDAHIDNKLLAQFSDSIHECALLKDQLPEHIRHMPDLPILRFCFLWEHKSSKPYEPIEAQNERYRYAIISSDLKNKKHPSIVIPILLYHGATKWDKKMLFELFEPYLPPELLEFIPHPKYIVIDIQNTGEDEIEKMVDLSVLRGAFIALKHGHDRNFFKRDMEKVLKFVEDLPTVYLFQEFFKMLLEYMQRRSKLDNDEFNKIVDQKLEPDMASNFKTIFEVAEEKGMEKGMEKGIEKGIVIGEQRGIVIGEQIGEQKGIAIGEARSKEILRKAIIALIRTSSLTNAEIAEELETDETLIATIRLAVRIKKRKKTKK
jgi:Putative transposase, YhgA-like